MAPLARVKAAGPASRVERLELGRSYDLLRGGATSKAPVTPFALPTIRTDLFVARRADAGFVVGLHFHLDAMQAATNANTARATRLST